MAENLDISMSMLLNPEEMHTLDTLDGTLDSKQL